MSIVKAHIGILLICFIFFILGTLRLNDRSLLTPDSCQYLIWGNSLAHGKGFIDETHPIPDKFVNHGPLYSLLIAPIELVTPLSLPAVKLWTLLFGIMSIVFCYLLLLKLLGKTQATIGSIIFASNPLLLVYSTEVLSDVPFIAAVMLSLYLFYLIEERPSSSKFIDTLFLLSTLAAALLREIGLALVVAYCVFYILRKDWKRLSFLVGTVLVGLGLWDIRNNILVEKSPFSQTGNMPWIFEHVSTSKETSIFIEIPVRFWYNFKAYSQYLFGMMLFPTFITRQLATLLDGSSSLYKALEQFFTFVKYLVFCIVIPTSLLGIYSGIKSFITTQRFKFTPANVFLLFVIFYLGILFLFPFNDVRYMLPLVPFLLYFTIKGIEKIFTSNKQSLWYKRIILFALLLILPNVVGISEIIRNNIRSNESPVLPWKEFGSWIQQHTPDDCIIASPIKDLAIVVGANRKVLNIYPTIETPKFESLLRDFHVEYLLSPNWYEDATVFDFQENASTRLWFEHCFSAGGLHLFKVHSLLKESRHNKPVHYTSQSVSSELLNAQTFLLNQNYDSANILLSKAMSISPDRPDVVFANILLSASSGNLEKTEKLYQLLLSLPSDVGIYVAQAHKQIDLLKQTLSAKQEQSQEDRSVQLYAVATEYWKMGYYQKAFSIMQELLRNDSTYFTGLLWGTHYALQLDNIPVAKQYLAQLETIERVNPIVKTYHGILQLENSLATSENDTIISQLHVKIGEAYFSLELMEEAFDEAEQALRFRPTNQPAFKMMSAILEKKSLPQMAEKVYNHTQQ